MLILPNIPRANTEFQGVAGGLKSPKNLPPYFTKRTLQEGGGACTQKLTGGVG